MWRYLGLFICCLLSEGAWGEPFTVGVILPLSGPVAEFGVAARNGVELAIKDNPEKLGSINFRFEDSQYDGKKTILAYRKLKEQNGAGLIFNWGTETGLAISPLALADKFPVISVSHDPKVSIGNPYLIRFINSSEQFVELQADYITTKGYKKIGIIKTELSYFNAFFAELKSKLPNDVVLEVVQSVQVGDQDFKIPILKMKDRNYDAVGVFLLTGQIAPFYKQAKELHFKLPSFGTDAFDSSDEVDEAMGLMDGAVFTNIEVTKSFRERYLKAFGNDVQVQYAGNAYDFALLVADLVKENPQDLIMGLKMPGKRMGVTGEYEYLESPREGQYFKFPIILKMIEGKEIRELQ